jgi:hypothetical protein
MNVQSVSVVVRHRQLRVSAIAKKVTNRTIPTKPCAKISCQM